MTASAPLGSVPRAIIVGGGVLGSMHAREARRHGYEVVHLERELEARGASVRNFGLVWISGRRPGAELELALRARTLWQEIAVELPEVGFRENGSLTLVTTEPELRVLEQVVARDDAHIRGVALLDAAEVARVNPAVRGHVLAGLHCRLDAAVESRRVLPALRAALERMPGYSWHPGVHVVDVADGHVVDHRGRRHEGDLVVVCPGAATSFGGWESEEAPLRRVRLHMLETEPFPQRLATSIADGDSLRYYPAFDVPALQDLPAAPPLVEDLALQLLVQQRLDGCLTIGDSHELEEPFDFSIREAPYAHFLARTEELLGTALPPVRMRWAGVYSQPRDTRLYYRHRIGDRTLIVTGAAGRGMTCSPAIAEDVFEEIVRSLGSGSEAPWPRTRALRAPTQ